MKNREKFKTAKDRIAKFNKVCGTCEKVDCNRYYALECFNAWLEEEAEEEKMLKCPFCGHECEIMFSPTRNFYFVRCKNQACAYDSCIDQNRDLAIAKHNRVARAVMEANEEVAE